MGILDQIKSFFENLQPKQTARDAKPAINAVKNAGKNGNYVQASLHALNALESIGASYAGMQREDYTTAREFGKRMIDTGIVSEEDIEPILVNFEIAKYAEMEISQEAYQQLETSIDVVHDKFRKGKPTTEPRGDRSGRSRGRGSQQQRRRPPPRRGQTGAARQRKPRQRRERR